MSNSFFTEKSQIGARGHYGRLACGVPSRDQGVSRRCCFYEVGLFEIHDNICAKYAKILSKTRWLAIDIVASNMAVVY